MGCSSSRAWLALLLVACALPGCWTGHLLESARRRESAQRFEAAFVAGQRLTLDYRVAVRDRRGRELRQADRRAAVALSDLVQQPELALDAVRVDFDPSEPAGKPVALLRDAERALPVTALVLRVAREAGRDVVLQVEAGDPVSGIGRLRAGSLTRDRTAPWVWPLVPFAVALDVAVLPLHVLAFGFFALTPE